MTTMQFPMTLAEIEADSVPAIQHWMDQYPMLWWGGVADLRQLREWPAGRLEKNRTETRSEYGAGQVIRAAQFIDQAPRIASFNRRHGSYGWKHAAERLHQLRAPGRDYYVGEGAFLIAAWSMGLRCSRKGQPGAYLNLGERAYISFDDTPPRSAAA